VKSGASEKIFGQIKESLFCCQVKIKITFETKLKREDKTSEAFISPGCVSKMVANGNRLVG